MLLLLSVASAQQPGGNKQLVDKKDLPDSADQGAKAYKTKLPQALIVPGILIGYGLTTIKDNGIYSSYEARADILKAFGKYGSSIDDYLIYVPYVEFGALLLLKVKCKNDMLNTALLIAKSELIMWGLVWTLKYTTNMTRPDGSDNHSFPSGHTSEAFVAATIVYREYRHLSAWYGAGAYAVAASVAAYRMINDKHWQSDVLVGAGIGMLSANLVYATHLHRWGRKAVCVMPTYNGTSRGFAMVYKF